MQVLKSALLAGVGLAAAVVVYPGDLFPIGSSHTSTSSAEHEIHGSGSGEQQRQGETMLSESFDVGAGGSLFIDIPDGDVELETTSGSGVQVDVTLFSRDMEWAREIYDRMQFEAAVQGNTVRITARTTRIRRGEWRRNRSFSVVTRVRVPARFNADINTEDGDIFIGDLEGRAVLNSSDGDIDVGTISGESLSIETSDGDITADALAVTRTEIRTSDGDIDIGTANGAVQATTSDGDIRLRLGNVQDVRLRTSDGDITIYAPATLAASVDFDGEDLDVSRSFEIAGRITRRRLSGDMNGGGPLLSASTHDGSITLRQSSR